MIDRSIISACPEIAQLAPHCGTRRAQAIFRLHALEFARGQRVSFGSGLIEERLPDERYLIMLALVVKEEG
ncbi:MAG: hypothetical protein WBA51_06135 [Erythrobacter sp.]